jgi:cytochrome o ubiquinol oxidase operon protein cyoD
MKIKELSHGTLSSLSLGFVLSLLLTLSSYFMVTLNIFDKNAIPITILFLAFMQLVGQSIFFLHLDKENKGRWRLVFFISTFSVVLIVIVASIWIMNSLYSHMAPDIMTKHLLRDEGMKNMIK